MNRRGLLLAAVQVVLVLSLGAKLQYDRLTCPRVWVRIVPVDPNMPVRGRYLSFQVEAEARGRTSRTPDWPTITLSVEDGQLIARQVPGGSVRGVWNGERVILSEPLAFFTPELPADTTMTPAAGELWVEVTVPPKGPPRPIRLEVRP
jgi:hypothetical protein